MPIDEIDTAIILQNKNVICVYDPIS